MNTLNHTHSIIAFEHAGGNISVKPVVSPDGSTVYFESEDNNIYAIQTNASGADPTILWNSNNAESPPCTVFPDAAQPLTISQDGLWLFRSCQINTAVDPNYPTYSYQIEAIHTATGKHAWDKNIMNVSYDYSQDMTPYVLIGGDGIPYTFITLTFNLPAPPPPPPPPPPSMWSCSPTPGTCVLSWEGQSENKTECENECTYPSPTPPPAPIPPPPTPPPPYSINALSAFDPTTGALHGPHILPNNTDTAQCNKTYDSYCAGWNAFGSGEGLTVSPDGMVVIGTAHDRYSQAFGSAANLITGAPIWTTLLAQWKSTSVTFSPDSKMFYALEATSGITAYNAATGNQTWFYEGVGTFSAQSLGVTPDSTTLIAGNTDGFVYALKADTGAIKWIFNAGGSIYSRLQFVQSAGSMHVYVTCANGVVYALDTTDGTEHWSYRTGYPIEGSAAVTPPNATCSKRVYFGADDSRLYSLAA